MGGGRCPRRVRGGGEAEPASTVVMISMDGTRPADLVPDRLPTLVALAARGDVTWAFLLFYSGLVLGRAAWLGDPLAVPLHHPQSRAFLIFAFFMISDPKTTPDSRTGRLVFAALVAAGGAFVSFRLYEPHGLLWALAGAALLVPVLDRLFPAQRYRWPGRSRRPEITAELPPQTVPQGAFAMGRRSSAEAQPAWRL